MLPKIPRLNIDSDSLSNRGLKRLLSLNFLHIHWIGLTNTCITTDCVRILNKMDRDFWSIEIL